MFGCRSRATLRASIRHWSTSPPVTGRSTLGTFTATGRSSQVSKPR